MGQALIKGLLAQGLSRGLLGAADAKRGTREAVRRRFGIWTRPDHAALVRRSDVVILAVKPQQFPEVVPELAPLLSRRRLVISIAAGITLRWLRARLPGVPLVRVMPNLPAIVGCGFAGVAAGRGTTRRHREIALAIFGSVGAAVELPERHLNAVTAVSGSGPAYVFFLVEAWERAARTLGLPAPVASAAIRRTLEGSARLLAGTSESPTRFIKQVASKRGTTEAALKVLARRRVAAHIVEAIRAAARRAKELSV
jgi:pyrroline-5-carboxylate reductase